MKVIPQRELRNRSGAVLREAEAGEVFTITVDGRPVATLGPYRRRQWAAAHDLEELIASPTDETLLDDVRAAGETAADDPWARR